MPYYDYKCTNTKCEYQFEVKQGINDPPLSRCLKCEGKVKRLLPSGLMRIKSNEEFYKTHRPDTRVKSESGVLSRRVSETDRSNIDEETPTRIDSMGCPRATPTRPRFAH